MWHQCDIRIECGKRFVNDYCLKPAPLKDFLLFSGIEATDVESLLERFEEITSNINDGLQNVKSIDPSANPQLIRCHSQGIYL